MKKPSLELVIEYRTSWLSKTHAENIAHTFISALKSVLSKSDQTVDKFDMLSDQDWHSIWKWNGQMPGNVESCLHSLVEQQVRLSTSIITTLDD